MARLVSVDETQVGTAKSDPRFGANRGTKCKYIVFYCIKNVKGF
jgi:hypothetical protein